MRAGERGNSNQAVRDLETMRRIASLVGRNDAGIHCSWVMSYNALGCREHGGLWKTRYLDIDRKQLHDQTRLPRFQ
jgi:hypothetical protein